MRIIDVIDNRAEGSLYSENGLSLFVSCENGEFLFDTGASESVLENLASLGIDKSRIKNIILSHNHNDHTGGLRSIINEMDVNKIYVSKDFKGEFLKIKDNNEYVLSDNGIITDYFDKVSFVEDEVEIFKGVYLCKVLNPNPKYICQDKNLFERANGEIIKDSFRHEIYVAVIEKDEINLITACTHNGIINVIEDAKNRFPNKKISTITGGLHIKNYMSDEEIKTLSNDLEKYDIKAIFSCHCTGARAEDIMDGHHYSLYRMSAGSKIDTCKTL